MLESEESQSLKVYWESLRNGSEVPRRADFRPEKITHLLSRIMIMEWLKTDYLSIRLAGTFFSERLGYDPTGKSAIDYFPDETADIYKQFLTLVTVQPCACNITFNSMLKTGATVQLNFSICQCSAETKSLSISCRLRLSLNLRVGVFWIWMLRDTQKLWRPVCSILAMACLTSAKTRRFQIL